MAKKPKVYYWVFPSKPSAGQPYIERTRTGYMGYDGSRNKVREFAVYEEAMDWWVLADKRVRP